MPIACIAYCLYLPLLVSIFIVCATRRMDTHTGKGIKLNDEDLKKAVQDCQLGFDEVQNVSGGRFRLPVGPASLTADPTKAVDPGLILAKHAPISDPEGAPGGEKGYLASTGILLRQRSLL